jgi:hypothetical protein
LEGSQIDIPKLCLQDEFVGERGSLPSFSVVGFPHLLRQGILPSFTAFRPARPERVFEDIVDTFQKNASFLWIDRGNWDKP